MLAELADIHVRGYAVSHGERLLGVSALAAPIRGVEDSTAYCIAVAGPTVRLQAREAEIGKLIRAAAAEVSRQYGGAFDPSLAKQAMP